MKRKVKNYKTDLAQFRRYSKVIKKDIPKTLDEFQNIKYKNAELWKELKKKYALKR